MSLEDYDIWNKAGRIDLAKANALFEGNPGLISEKDEFGNTYLHWAISQGYGEIVSLLIDWGADVNLQDNNGWTPMHHAVNRSDRALIDLLVHRGAIVNMRDNANISPLLWAMNCGKDDIVDLLTQYGAEI